MAKASRTKSATKAITKPVIINEASPKPLHGTIEHSIGVIGKFCTDFKPNEAVETLNDMYDTAMTAPHTAYDDSDARSAATSLRNRLNQLIPAISNLYDSKYFKELTNKPTMANDE